MKIKIVVLIIIIMGIVLMPVVLYNIGNRYFSREGIYEENWDINLPSDFKKIIHYQDQHDFQGDGRRYTVYETKETSFLPINPKNSEEIQTIAGDSKNGRNDDIEEFVKTIAADLKINEIYKPKFNYYYVWQKLVKYDDALIVIYFPNSNKVYFVEEIM